MCGRLRVPANRTKQKPFAFAPDVDAVVESSYLPTTPMPPSGRKSSLASSRNGPKKYIPYRADDFQHGKKTGMIVETVDHTDEFEPFDKVIGQADKHTPYRVQNSRKRRVTKTPVAVENNFDDDEYGEVSMELDDSTFTHPSPPRVLCALTR